MRRAVEMIAFITVVMLVWVGERGSEQASRAIQHIKYEYQTASFPKRNNDKLLEDV